MMARSNGAADVEVADDEAAGLPDVEDFFGPILLFEFAAAFGSELSFDFELHWLEMSEFGPEILALLLILGCL